MPLVSLRRALPLLFCLLLLGSASAGGDPDNLLGPDEFGLNFAAGKPSARVYGNILSPVVSGARIRVGAQVSPGLFGISVEGRADGASGSVSIQRPFRTVPIEGGFDAQVVVQAEPNEVTEGSRFGLERSVRDGQGSVIDSLFVGVTPNPGIKGLTAACRQNEGPIGFELDLPSTEAAGLLIQQDTDGTRAYARSAGSQAWTLLAAVGAPQAPTNTLEFIAEDLGRGDRVYFHNFLAQGLVNGPAEQTHLQTIAGIRDLTEEGLDSLALGVPGIPAAELSFGAALFLAEPLKEDLNNKAGSAAFLPTTDVKGTLKSANKEVSLLKNVLRRLNDENVSEATALGTAARTYLDRMSGSLRGFRAKDNQLIVLVRPTLIAEPD